MAHIQRGSSTFQFLQSGNGQANVEGVTIIGVAQDFIPDTETGISGPDFSKTMATVQLTFSDFVTEFTLNTAAFNSDEIISGYNIGKPTELTGDLVQTHRGVTSDVYGLHATGEGDLVWQDILTKTITFRITASGRGGVLLKGFSFTCQPNSAPVAEVTSHDDKTEIDVGQMHALSALSSTDAENDKLDYRWRVVSQPEGAGLRENISSRISFSFRPIVVGEYTFELVVSDGKEESEPKLTTITVVQPNRPPFATVRAHFSPQINQAVLINAVTVSDLDRDELTYRWTLDTPQGSNASLDDPTVLHPTFTPDVAGRYTSTLIVNDGSADSPPAVATWTVDPLPESDPIAHAGEDIALETGVAVLLDGSKSCDLEGTQLTYHWSVTDKPKGSRVSLAYASLAQSQFKPDVNGQYTIELKVSDGDKTSDAAIATYVAANPNNKPIAMIEKGGLVNVGTEVQLSSEGSSDPDGDEITFCWTLETPAGSSAQLSDATAANPTFTPDVEGVFGVTLVVNDGQLDSDAVQTVWDAQQVQA